MPPIPTAFDQQANGILCPEINAWSEGVCGCGGGCGLKMKVFYSLPKDACFKAGIKEVLGTREQKDFLWMHAFIHQTLFFCTNSGQGIALTM